MTEDDEGGEARLPVLGGIWRSIRDASRPPTLEQARDRLGGPFQGGSGIGRRVTVGDARVGVVIHAGPAELDVWIGGGRIQRVGVAEAADAPSSDRDALEAVADDARVHTALREGQRVAFLRRDGSIGEGRLAEKLRYGSLVGLDDGRVVAVSFRRLAPADGPSEPS
ncbi:MAG TPA: hypothetical protein RMH99_04340 [Sandaracinaceae bacterium LLY-WYZ-13_1]|nr:hypothetical protein [Sandaracinaceae bacterium LLY-WYZ-13_1]